MLLSWKVEPSIVTCVLHIIDMFIAERPDILYLNELVTNQREEKPVIIVMATNYVTLFSQRLLVPP